MPREVATHAVRGRSPLTRTVLPAVLALVVAGLFVRLGFWQLERRDQRRARNAVVSARLEASPMLLAALTADTSMRFRRVAVTGRADYGRERVLAGRSRNGAPGVHILTPVLVAPDTAVFVNRGWIYSPNGSDADLQRWREPNSVTMSGYVELFSPDTGSARPDTGTGTRVIRNLRHAVVARDLPYATLPFYVVALDPHGGRAGDDPRLRVEPIDSATPVRLQLPSLDDGPHGSYAIQWFAFALIALVGVGLLIRMELRG